MRCVTTPSGCVRYIAEALPFLVLSSDTANRRPGYPFFQARGVFDESGTGASRRRLVERRQERVEPVDPRLDHHGRHGRAPAHVVGCVGDLTGPVHVPLHAD
jgi:hypothetical protein